MDEIVAAEHQVNAAMATAKADGLIPQELPTLSIERWKPTQFDAPGIYHMISSSPFEQRDDYRWRDTLNILVRIGVAYGSDSEEMYFLEPYTDLWKSVMDPLISTRTQPFNGAATWAERTDMRSVEDSFNDVPYACMEFVVQCRLDRMIQT
jgi:hypothetical protein